MASTHNNDQTLGQKLRDLRDGYDLSQGQVAAALNIDRSTYTNYELDKTRPSLETLVKLAHIFNVPRDALLPEYEPSEKGDIDDIIRPNGMSQSLNKEERGLLVLFRSLRRDQKNALKDAADKISKGLPL